jgi:hypothetical protein
MYRTMVTVSLLSVAFIVSSLLIVSSFENAVIKVQQATAQNPNNSDNSLKLGPPQKITLSQWSKPPVLSPEKKQALEQDQAKTHHNPELPISDQSILGPILGTQAQ